MDRWHYIASFVGRRRNRTKISKIRAVRRASAMTSALQGNDGGCCHGNKHHCVALVHVAVSGKLRMGHYFEI
jgi:hypothetical protein